MVASTSASSAIGSAKAALRHIRRDRQPRRDRLVLAPEGLIEAAHEIHAKAGGERRARAVDHIGDAFESDLRQIGRDIGRDAQSGEREGGGFAALPRTISISLDA